MTLITAILDRAARQCSITVPTSWLTASNTTAKEIMDFLDQTISDIQDRLDLTGPISKQAEIVGTGAETYPLPADMVRLHRSEFAVYERMRTWRACVPVVTDGEWEYLKELGTTGAYRFYRVTGYEGAFQISFQRPLDTGVTVLASYVSENWLVNAGIYKDEISDAADQSLLPRRLVEAGIVWRFRQRKGLEYGDIRLDYETQMARYINDSRTIRRVAFGAVPTRGPFDIPVPDYIPPA
jgi:hypothetical protein